MRKSLVALLLVLGAAASTANLALAAMDEQGFGSEGLKEMNAQMSKELRSRAARLGTSAGTSDTTWVGYTPGHTGPGNYWSIYAGFGKDGYYLPINGVAHKGDWDFETPVNGDSLQGWYPLRNLYATTGGQTRTDRNRPWWAIDFGNMANYRINQANGRTFGVVGVWHRDGGSLQSAPAGVPSPGWAPAVGSFSAWMGVRAHGDNNNVDAITNNPFNQDILSYYGFGSVSPDGNDEAFPGYGSQMDQMLYRDIDFTGAGTSTLTVHFKFRTVMSTGVGTTASTRTGWFDSDPLGVTSGPTNPQLNNFISSSDAGDALAPQDSFMVYVGTGVENNTWLPAASNFGQNLPAQSVYDKQRRWFGEVLHWDRDPASPTSNPQPKFYKELLSVAGNWPARSDSTNPGYVDTTFAISNTVLSPFLTKNNKIRLVFRVKTNRGFDDQGTSYTSNKRGAAVIDNVTYAGSTLPAQPVGWGEFEGATDINNATNVSAVSAWKSTGKPPSIFMHAHLFSDLIYEDLCGQKGDISRQCNMSGIVISAGDNDNGQAAGGLIDGTAERERNDMILSPAIQLGGPYTNAGGTNTIGLKAPGTGAGDADASEDYYVWYDIYTAIMDPFSKGNLWRYACMSYPANARAPFNYPAWGQMRFPPFLIFNPDPQCLIDFEQLVANGMVKSSSSNGIPDSIKVGISKQQSCFRFGVSAACSPTDGAYFDNISLALIDGQPAQLTAQIWDWINDSFPANEQPGLPGTAAFDTAGAHVMTGVNNAQSPNSNLRFDVPGDSVLISSSGNTARVDMVFRILPGPGNYEPIGRPDIGHITKIPQNRAIVTKGDNSFWDAYAQVPGDFASPGAIANHHNAPGGWDPNTWNSARCDTAEGNLFARQAPGSANVLGGPGDPTLWMSTLHESDPHFNQLGITHNRCFVTGPADPATSTICNGTVPTYISSRPEHADVTGTTKEGTKIIPDGLLTAGAHVEYFFRDQKDTATPNPVPDGFVPDTNVVFQNPTEGSTDGHRWQEFSVLPNRWKNPSFKHPVANLFGTGPACLLVVDNNDRRGNERVWVSVSDTIGAVPSRWWGAHNGWHAVGGGDLDNPADNRVAKGGPAVAGYVSEHLGQPGSGGSWDMYQVKGSESLTTGAGSLGSRKANRTGTPGQQIVIAKSSHQGPTPEMLNTYYTFMLYLSGDLNSGILGPYSNRSQNDAGILMDWLNAASSATQNRGFWAIGDGFAESNIFAFNGQKQITDDLMLNFFGCDLVNPSYIVYSGNTDDLASYRLLPAWQNKLASQVELFGMRNLCLWTNDVLTPGGVGLPTLATVTSEYDRRSAPHAFAAPAGVFKDWVSTSPYKTLIDGWDIEHITGPADVNTVDRNGYFYKVFVNVWSKLCQVQGTPIVILDVPSLSDDDLVNFVNLRNNPLARGQATVDFGLAKADRVEVKVYDVSGRLVRTLADRQFAAGPQKLTWDGTDNGGHQVARGVYFTQVKYQNARFAETKKLTVLK